MKSSSPGEIILTARRAAGLTQKASAERIGITQAEFSRYENDLRVLSDITLEAIADSFNVTTKFLLSGWRVEGAIASENHMRNPPRVRPSIWSRLEAQLNLHRHHMMFLLDEVDMHTDVPLPGYDSLEYTPEEIARMVRLLWRLPFGPVRDLSGWMETTGCLIFDQDPIMNNSRAVSLSQIADSPYPLVMVNNSLPTDRRRAALAHELGHLCMHSLWADENSEMEADRFASEFLMPSQIIRNELKEITVEKLLALKQRWGVPMKDLIVKGRHLGVVTGKQQIALRKKLSYLGWLTQEPGSDTLPPELPGLVRHIGRSMTERGLSRSEVSLIAGYSNTDNPLLGSHIRVM